MGAGEFNQILFPFFCEHIYVITLTVQSQTQIASDILEVIKVLVIGSGNLELQV